MLCGSQVSISRPASPPTLFAIDLHGSSSRGMQYELNNLSVGGDDLQVFVEAIDGSATGSCRIVDLQIGQYEVMLDLRSFAAAVLPHGLPSINDLWAELNGEQSEAGQGDPH
jgi:hypothetical protein